MKIVLFAFILFVPLAIIAQTRQYASNNKEALNFYSQAKQSLDYQLYDQAIQQLKLALSADSNFIEARNQLADVLKVSKQYKPAAQHYLKIINTYPEFNRAIYFNLGESEINLADYKNAQNHLEKYITYPNINPAKKQYAELLIKDCIFSLNAIQNPVHFNPVNLGAQINTTDDEYMPVVTADESEFIFTRKTNNNEDFYKSNKQKNGWGNAVYLSAKINTPNYNEGAQSVTQDGQYLFFTGCDRPTSLGKCDIYVAKRNGDDWGEPNNLNYPVNTRAWESQPSISSDERTLYFVSNRKGGYGGYDIWKTIYTDKGWSDPENLGPNINTPYDEQSPFIHPDDNTLYFSSNGWPGMGNMDIFVSRRDKGGQWQKPENLGYPINTSADESGLTLNATGNLAYFSSNVLKGYGGYDIYSFELPVALRPQIVTYVKGMVKDSKTKVPLIANVEIIDLENSKPVLQSVLNNNGQFLATLTSGKNYGLNISKQGYMFYSENFSLSDKNVKSPFIIEVPLQAIEAGNKVILKNIFFDTDKFEIKPQSKTELGKLIIFLTDNPKVKIEISGHTDNVGNDIINKTLSENRANAVYKYLISQSIQPYRLKYKGYGKSQPTATNNTDAGRQLNRRTEFKIISN